MPLGESAKVAMPCSRAQARPARRACPRRPARSHRGSRRARAASTSAIMFEPRPEIRTPTLRLHFSPSRCGGAISRMRRAPAPRAPGLGRRRRRCSPSRRSTTSPMRVHRLARRLRARAVTPSASSARDDHRHADPAIEGARHFVGLDTRPAPAGTPSAAAAARRRHRSCAWTPVGQDARDILEQAAAGDMRQARGSCPSRTSGSRLFT